MPHDLLVVREDTDAQIVPPDVFNDFQHAIEELEGLPGVACQIAVDEGGVVFVRQLQFVRQPLHEFGPRERHRTLGAGAGSVNLQH